MDEGSVMNKKGDIKEEQEMEGRALYQRQLYKQCSTIKKSLRDCWVYEEPILTPSKELKVEEDITEIPPTSDTTFLCDHCLGDFNDELTLKHHIRSVHNTAISDPVSLTEKQPDSSNNVPRQSNSLPTDSNGLPRDSNISSSRREVTNTPYLYECDCCGYKTMNRNNMIDHFRMLTDRHYNCNYCDECFSQACRLRMHSIKMHQVSYARKIKKLTEAAMKNDANTKTFTKYECETCPKIFHKYASLLQHVRRGNHKALKCDYCNYATSVDLSLARHIRRAHKGDKPYSCDICDFACTRRKYLENHLKKHIDNSFKDKPYSCDICDFACTKRKYLEDHLKKHIDNSFKDKPPKNRNFICDFCGYKTEDGSGMRKHLRLHTGAKPYSCDHCDKSYAQSGSLRVHQQMAHDLSWHCNQCDFKTTSEANVTKHSLMHDKARNFVCEICKYRFARAACLRRHKARRHKTQKKKQQRSK